MFKHEPRRHVGRDNLYCVSDGQPWPCAVEAARRAPSLRHVSGDCPACSYVRDRVQAEKAEARAALERSLRTGGQS